MKITTTLATAVFIATTSPVLADVIVDRAISEDQVLMAQKAWCDALINISKTHTMQGSGDGPMRGIIPRAMEQVGQYKLDLEGQGWLYEMEVTFIEIYNETIRDLLRSGPASSDLKHEIKKDEGYLPIFM